MTSTNRRRLRIGGLTLAALWGCLVLPAVFHGIRNLCPVRPSSIPTAQAVPAFARKYAISCSQCHSAFPALNAYGRQFKLDGYVRDRSKEKGADMEEGNDLLLPEKFPWGAVVKSRPYDRTNGGDHTKVRALHELELFLADGSVAEDFSYFTVMAFEDDEKVEVEGTVTEVGSPAEGHEVEAEGESGFTLGVNHLRLGYHPNQYLNVIAAYDTFLGAVDPYQTLGLGTHQTIRMSDTLGLIAGHHGGAHTMAVRGQVKRDDLGGLMYAYGMENDNAHGAFAFDGDGPFTHNLRLVFDSFKGLAVGGYAQIGQDTWSGDPAGKQSPVNKETLLAVDVLGEFAGVTGRAAYVSDIRKVRATDALRTDRRGGYVEVFYPVKRDDRPWLVPLARYDIVRDRRTDRTQGHLVGQLAYYFKENVRVLGEYYAETRDTLAGAKQPKDSRWVLQAEIGF